MPEARGDGGCAARPAAAIDLGPARFGYRQFRANDNTAPGIDATGASWVVSNHGPRQNLYPVLIDGSVPGVRLSGGTVGGGVPLDLDWVDIYTNSAAVMVRDAPGAEIRGWTISRAWDGIRLAGASDGFLIDGVTLDDIRDDAIENDYGLAGTIANSLLDGVFSGLSMTKKDLPDASRNVVTLDTVLMRMRSFPFRGRTTHQSPFKVDDHSPSLRIFDSVIAIEDVDHIGRSRLRTAWDKTLEASGNVFLNLSDRPLPADYPPPGRGWTVLEGQAARAYWDRAVADRQAPARPAVPGPGSVADDPRDPGGPDCDAAGRVPAREIPWPAATTTP